MRISDEIAFLNWLFTGRASRHPPGRHPLRAAWIRIPRGRPATWGAKPTCPAAESGTSPKGSFPPPNAPPKLAAATLTFERPCEAGTGEPLSRTRAFLLQAGIELGRRAVYLTPCGITSPKTGTSCTKSQENREPESKTAIRRPKQPPPSRDARPDAPRPAVANPCATLRNNRGPRALTRGPYCAGELNFQQVVVEAKEHLSNGLSISGPLFSQGFVKYGGAGPKPGCLRRVRGAVPGLDPVPKLRATWR